jgi:hypothetical protein
VGSRKPRKKGPGENREQVNYLLPTKLARKIRREAADRGMWPSEIAIERLEKSYTNGRVRNDAQRTRETA